MTLRRPALSVLVSVLLATAALVGLGAPAHADTPLTSIRINEVESNGGTPVDWIELTNIGATATDVSGMILMDNQARTFAIASGMSIPAGGYLAVDVDIAGGFGLGAADSARVFLPDGTTLVDTYTWTAHATVTYGRCPNGTGAFGQTSSTKGLANDCPPTGLAAIRFNEVESNGDPIGDWAELTNISADPVDISGLKFKDGDDTHAFYSIPAATTLAAGGYYALDEAAFGFGLGAADSVRLFQPDGTTSVDSYAWTEHAVTSYGRCPDGTGPFATTGAPTKGAVNNCAPLVKINEIESDGGAPADWVELLNYGAASQDVSGLVVKDNDDAHSYAIPAATTIPGGGYLVLEQAALGFELDANDSARLFAANGATLYDSYAWTSHSTTSYGRCPNGTGAFASTQVVTKGALNNCPGDLITEPWPGGASVATADVNGQLGGDISGLDYEGSGGETPGVLWAVDNGAGALLRLVWNGSAWTTDTTDGWSAAGKSLKYLDGTGVPDTEGMTLGGPTSAAGVYTATERNNAANGVSRLAILRYDVSGSATTFNATNEWSLTADLPAVSPNLGIEDITLVPDSYLTANGFLDESTGATYSPANYPNHGNGIFFVGLESNGMVYAYALNHANNTYTRVATFFSGFSTGVMGLDFDRSTNQLWTVCDDTCTGRSAVWAIDTAAGPNQGKFRPLHYYERPAGMPNLNNEGFTTTPRSECVGGSKPVFWSDDSQTGGNALRAGTLTCTPRVAQTVAFTSTKPASAVVGQTYAATATGGASGNPVVLSVAATPAGACTIAGGTVTFKHPGACVVNADQAGNDDYTAGSATGQSITIARAATTGTVTVTATNVSATVAPVAPGAGIPTGIVRFSVGGVEVGTASLSNGVASLDYVVPTGATRTILATYLGSTDFAESGATKVRRDPTISVQLVPSSGAASDLGWYDGSVQVVFTCTPNGSPLVGSCPAPVTLGSSGEGQVVGGVVKAQDGGKAVASSGPIDIDLDAPTVTVGGVKDGKTYRQKPTPVCVAGDQTSYVVTCTLKIEKVARGRFNVRVAAVDAAGHVSTAVESFSVKKRTRP